MNGGPVGNGLSYLANIKISGRLTAAQLKAVTGKINAILKAPGVKGKIVAHARVSDNVAKQFKAGFPVNENEGGGMAAIEVSANGNRRSLEAIYLELCELAKSNGLKVEYQLTRDKPGDPPQT